MNFWCSLLNTPAKKFWSLSGCREPKSLKTTALESRPNMVTSFKRQPPLHSVLYVARKPVKRLFYDLVFVTLNVK
jgi:hypothetical protein